MLIDKASNYLVQHPAVGKALGRIAGSVSLKINAEIGLEESIGKNGAKVSAAASATGYWQFSKNGVSAGSDVKLAHP